MIDITGLDKAAVLKALYDNSKPQGLGFLHYVSGDMSIEEARSITEQPFGCNQDYLKGRVLKIDISDHEFDPRLYDRDNGDGAAARAIKELR